MFFPASGWIFAMRSRETLLSTENGAESLRLGAESRSSEQILTLVQDLLIVRLRFTKA